MELELTVGLEIHAEIKTRTKMFCFSANNPDAKPNQNICPVCLAHPGTLPVINKRAVASVLKVGKALGAQLAAYTEFDRKNYFYPDIPKGYQISQYAYPLVSGGSLEGVKVTRVHLEEDTAKSTHDPLSEKTYVDFNRAGVPLMELVTEPVIKSPKQAGDFGRALQLLLRALDVSDADMERGQMRVEANISVAPPGERGTKVEVKNLNSFRSVERAIAFEFDRQSSCIGKGEAVLQETRGWDEAKQVTFAQRSKEVAADYRYFPDPDLPKLLVSDISDELYRIEEDALPWNIRTRYVSRGLRLEDAELLVRERSLATFFDRACSFLSDRESALAANYLTSDVVSIVRDTQERDAYFKEISANPEHFSEIIKMVSANEITSRAAKDLLREIFTNSSTTSPRLVAKERGLMQVNDESVLLPIIHKLVQENPSVVSEYRSGKEKALQFFVGIAMKETKGAANPILTLELAKKVINAQV